MSTKGKIIWENPNKNKAVNCPSCGRFMKFEKIYEDVFLNNDYYWSQWKTYACQCGENETVEMSFTKPNNWLEQTENAL